MKAIDKYKLDKHSLAVKMLKKNGFFEGALERDIDKCDFVGDAAKAKISLTEYVKRFCEETSIDEQDERLSEVAAYGMINFSEWCKYQQTYLLSDLAILDFASKTPAVLEEGFLLPFPTVLVALEFKEERKKLGFFIRQKENEDFDVVAFSSKILVYFPLDDNAFEQLNEKRFGGYFTSEAEMVLAAYAFFTVAFLSVYRQGHESMKVTKVLRKGTLKSKELKASEWRFSDSVIVEKLPDAGTSLRAAFDLNDLIPPSERKEEVIETEHTHASPRRHHVRAHTRIYWTGPGRKIPEIRTIQSYERGGKSDDFAGGAERICKPE